MRSDIDEDAWADTKAAKKRVQKHVLTKLTCKTSRSERLHLELRHFGLA
jgi:hypothetical protein